MSGDVVTGQLDLACWTALAGSSTTLVGAFQMEVSEIRSTEGQGYIRWWDVCHAQNQKKAEGEGALCFNGFTGYESKTNTDNTEASYYSVVWAVRLWVYEGNQEPVRLDGAVGTVFSQKQGPISIRREAVFLEDRSLLYRNYTFTQTSGEVFGEGKVEIKAANGLFSCNFKVSSGTKTGSCTRLESKICEVSPGVPCEPAQISW